MAVLFSVFFLVFFANFLAEAQATMQQNQSCESVTVSEWEILQILLANYSTSARPIINGTSPLPVYFGLVLDRIEDIVEKKRDIVLTGYMIMRWHDDYLVWEDKFPYNCIRKMIVPIEKIWLADIALINSGDKYSLLLARGHKAELSSSGDVSFFPSGTFTASCDINLRYFPFDHQKCVLRFGSWCYWKELQSIRLIDDPFQLGNYTENEQWSLLNITANPTDYQYPSDPRTWQKIEMSLYLKRKSDYYIINILIPSAIISLVEIVIFSLPIAKAIKIHISFTSLLAYSVFQLMVLEDMPRTSEHTPLLSIYIDLSMAYIGLVLICEGLVFVLLSRAEPHKPGPPIWLYQIVHASGRILGFTDYDVAILDETLSRDSFRLHQEQGNKPNEQQTNQVSNTQYRYSTEDAYNSRKVMKLFEEAIEKEPPWKMDSTTHRMKLNDNEYDLPLTVSVREPMTSSALIGSPGVPVFATGVMEADAQAQAVEGALVSHHRMWICIAKIIEMWTFIIYLLAIIMTPFVIFLILPATSPIAQD